MYAIRKRLSIKMIYKSPWKKLKEANINELTI